MIEFLKDLVTVKETETEIDMTNFCIALAGALTLRLKNIDVPSHVLVGNEARLSCEFDMEGGTLYSVKWYKDDNEFYRWAQLLVNR